VKLFRQRELMVFVRPVIEEEDLQKLNSLNLKELRPEFVKQFKILKDKIFKECPMKQMHGKPVSGFMLAHLLEQYVKAINEGAVPNISTAWDNVMNYEIRKIFELAERTYKEKAAKIIDFPMDEDKLVSEYYVELYIQLKCYFRKLK